MVRLFQFAVAVFGEAEARRIWAQFAKKPRGAPKGSRDPEKDRRLLAFYDTGISACESKTARARWPGRIGKWLAATEPTKYGNSAEAVTKHVRRLVLERDKRQTQEETMRRLFGTSHTVLSSLLAFAAPGNAMSSSAHTSDELDQSSSEGHELATK